MLKQQISLFDMEFLCTFASSKKIKANNKPTKTNTMNLSDIRVLVTSSFNKSVVYTLDKLKFYLGENVTIDELLEEARLDSFGIVPKIDKNEWEMYKTDAHITLIPDNALSSYLNDNYKLNDFQYVLSFLSDMIDNNINYDIVCNYVKRFNLRDYTYETFKKRVLFGD